MKWLKSLFKKEESEENIESFVIRQSKHIPTDKVFDAWSSGELKRMIDAAKIKTNLVDRHFLLQAIVAETYKLRKDSKYRNLCVSFAEMHLDEFDKIAPALKADMGGVLPRVTTFQYYATVLTEQGESEKAISVCQIAISYGLKNGTKSGFQGRIERIKKQN